MNYPLISEYIEAIKSAEDNFEELSYLKPVLGDDGLPVMTSGNFAVVFKMKDEQSGKFYAVKCFTKEQEGRAEAYREIAKELKDVSSPYLVSIQYLEKELFVDTDQSAETEFSVLLMDWVEGKPLDKYLRENLDDKYALEMLAYRFSQLAQWLIPQPFAHGDLKPDNILVREDGSLALVDYDGMYVPAMKGQKARELGSPDFRHPLRTENDFDEHIDDFPIISILLSLKAISLFPYLLNELDYSNGLLLSSEDYHNTSSCKLLKMVFPSENTELNNIIALFVLCLGDSVTNILSYLNLECPEHYYSTSVTEDDIRLALDIDFILYNRDKRKLLRRRDEIDALCYDCHIIEGTEIICDYAFAAKEFAPPYTIWLPKSIVKVGKDIFTTRYSPGISEIVVPKGYEQKYSRLMPQYKHLISCFTTKVNYEEIEEGESDKYGVIYSKDRQRLLSCPNSADIEIVEIQWGTKVICDGALAGQLTHDGYNSCFVHSVLKKVLLPVSIEIIGQNVFSHCISLRNIVLPNSLKKIYGGAFWRSSIEDIIIPKSVEFIGDLAFSSCIELKRIRFEGYTIIQSQGVFFKTNLKVIEIPKGSRAHYEHYLPNYTDKFVEQDPKTEFLMTEVTVLDLWDAWKDDYDVIYGNDKHRLLMGADIEEYTILDDTRVICDNAFENCKKLRIISIPNSVIGIGASAFAECKQLASIELHNGIKEIDGYTFSGCTSLMNIVLPQTLTALGYCSFIGCSSLKKIHLPKALKFVSWGAFSDCTSLTEVLIDSPDAIIHDEFNNCNPNLIIIVPKSSYKHYKQYINPEQLFWMQKLVDHESDDKDYITEILCNDKGKELFYNSYHQIKHKTNK